MAHLDCQLLLPAEAVDLCPLCPPVLRSEGSAIVKPAYFVCLLLFIAAPIFVSGQSNDISMVPHSPAGVLPPAAQVLDARRAAIRGSYGNLPPAFDMRRQPFSSWHGYSAAYLRSVRRAGMLSANPVANPIFLEAPTYSVGGESGGATPPRLAAAWAISLYQKRQRTCSATTSLVPSHCLSMRAQTGRYYSVMPRGQQAAKRPPSLA